MERPQRRASANPTLDFREAIFRLQNQIDQLYSLLQDATGGDDPELSIQPSIPATLEYKDHSGANQTLTILIPAPAAPIKTLFIKNGVIKSIT